MVHCGCAHADMYPEARGESDEDCKNSPQGLYDRMHRDYDSQSPEERSHNLEIWAVLMDSLLRRSIDFEDDEEEEFKRELAMLEGLRTLWPEGFEHAYAVVGSGKHAQSLSRRSFFSPHFAYETREPLRSFHLAQIFPLLKDEDIALVHRMGEVDGIEDDDKAVYDTLRRMLAWDTSRRCSWVVACVQLGLLADVEEAAACSQPLLQKRKTAAEL